MKIHPVEAELSLAYGWTDRRRDRQDEANSRFPQFNERSKKYGVQIIILVRIVAYAVLLPCSLKYCLQNIYRRNMQPSSSFLQCRTEVQMPMGECFPFPLEGFCVFL